MAAKHNSLESFKLLDDAGAEFKLQDDQGNTLLHEASKLGHLQICKVSYNSSCTFVNTIHKLLAS